MTGRLPAALLLAGACLTWNATARAVEREHQLGFDAGASMLLVADRSGPELGPALGVHYTYGLSDEFNFVAEGTWSLVSLGEKADRTATPTTRPSNVEHLGVGLGYVFDVLRWVPYVNALAGGYALTGGTVGGTRVLPGVAVAAGLDYRFDRSWAAGVALRWHFLFTDMSTYPGFTDTFARVEYTWGW